MNHKTLLLLLGFLVLNLSFSNVMVKNPIFLILLLISLIIRLIWPLLRGDDSVATKSAETPPPPKVIAPKPDTSAVPSTPKKDPANLAEIIAMLDKSIALTAQYDFLVNRFEEDKKARRSGSFKYESKEFSRVVGSKLPPGVIPDDSLRIYQTRFELIGQKVQDLPSDLAQLGYNSNDPDMSRLTEVRKLMYQRNQLKLQLVKIKADRKKDRFSLEESEYYSLMLNIEDEIRQIDSRLLNERYSKM